MAINNNNTTAGPAVNNTKMYGKGNWRICGNSTGDLKYSTDAQTWYELDVGNSPVTLYNTQLYVDTASNGEVQLLPEEIIPRYSRVSEKASKDERDKNTDFATFPDFYKEALDEMQQD